jgi:restriction system protein
MRKRKNSSPPLSSSVLVCLLLIFLATLAQISPPSFSSNLISFLLLGVPLCIVAICGGLVLLYQLRNENKRKWALNQTLEKLDHMSGITFEQYIGELLKTQGYTIEYTQVTGDFGIDILAHKDGTTTAIQVKRYASPVGITAVQQAIAGAHYYGCTRSMVVTNQTLTHAAWELAFKSSCWLIDRKRLTRWIETAQVSQFKYS